MRLEVPCILETQPRFGIHMPYQSLLGAGTGLCQDRGPTVLILARRPDDGAYDVSVPDGPLQWLDQQSDHAFASGVAVGPRVEAVGTSIRR
jgi:hypothetical protein